MYKAHTFDIFNKTAKSIVQYYLSRLRLKVPVSDIELNNNCCISLSESFTENYKSRRRNMYSYLYGAITATDIEIISENRFKNNVFLCMNSIKRTTL